MSKPQQWTLIVFLIQLVVICPIYFGGKDLHNSIFIGMYFTNVIAIIIAFNKFGRAPLFAFLVGGVGLLIPLGLTDVSEADYGIIVIQLLAAVLALVWLAVWSVALEQKGGKPSLLPVAKVLPLGIGPLVVLYCRLQRRTEVSL